MTVSRKIEREIIRKEYTEKVMELFGSTEEVMQVKSNEIAFPVVGCEGNEDFVVIVVKVPTGANKGTEPYDGYSMAEDYARKVAEDKAKAKKKEEEKERKRKRDEEIRRKKAEIAEKKK